MQRFEYTTVDRILSSFMRNVGDEDISEDNLIEWIGEALEHLYRKGSLQECILFAQVKNFTVMMPSGFKYVSGILKNKNFHNSNYESFITSREIIKESNLKCGECGEEIYEVPKKDCCCDSLEQELGCYLASDNPFDVMLRKNLNTTLFGIPLPLISVPWSFGYWYSSHMCKENFLKIKMSNTRFSKDKLANSDFNIQFCNDYYQLKGNCIKFSFESGQVAISYLRIPLDPETGYPLIPDEVSYLTAINYYLKWKLAEYYSWQGRQGFVAESERAMKLWFNYAAQARVKTIKNRTQDEFDMLNDSINNHKFIR